MNHINFKIKTQIEIINYDKIKRAMFYCKLKEELINKINDTNLDTNIDIHKLPSSSEITMKQDSCLIILKILCLIKRIKQQELEN